MMDANKSIVTYRVDNSAQDSRAQSQLTIFQCKDREKLLDHGRTKPLQMKTDRLIFSKLHNVEDQTIRCVN